MKFVKALIAMVPMKLIYAGLTTAAATGLGFLQAKFPGVSMPSPDTVALIGVAAITGHTITDSIYQLKTAGVDTSKAK